MDCVYPYSWLYSPGFPVKEGGRSPGLRHDMNRKRIILGLALGLILTLVCSLALAEDATVKKTAPIKVEMELSNNKFSGPEEITVSITVTNVGDGEMPSPVTLYYPSGKQVEEFGSPTLAAGASKNWSGKWQVTQKELEAGKIAFTVRYSYYESDDSEELVKYAKSFSRQIRYTGAAPELSVERKITPSTAQKDQEVTVAYTITNKGSVDITAVTIKENSGVSAKSGVIDTIAAGETGKYAFTVKMGTKDITSAATITYKAAGKSYTEKVESALIKFGKVNLSASLSADKKGGAPGDTVKLSLKLKNSGTVDFTNVSVKDNTLGEVFSGQTVPAGQTVTLEKDLTISETQELQFVVTGEDATGVGVETATGRLKVIATDPTQQIVLRVEAEADRMEVYRIPSVVRFTVTVHNESAVDVSNINVRAVESTVYTFESIPAGGTGSFTRDMEISMAGTYQFTASCLDQLSQTVSFPSNTIAIFQVEPTAVPTAAPLVTPPAPAMEPIPTDLREPEWLDRVETIADNAKWPLVGLAAVLLLLLLIGAIRRAHSRNQSKKAMDHLEGAVYPDYSTAPKRRHRSEIVSGSDEKKTEKPTTAGSDGTTGAAPSANAEQNGELMAETLKRLYTEPAKTEEPAQEPTAEAEPAKGAEPAAADAPEQETPATEEAFQEALAAARKEDEASGTEEKPASRRRGRKA